MTYRVDFNGHGPTEAQRLILAGLSGGDLCGKHAPFTVASEHHRYRCERARHGDGMCEAARADGALVRWWD